jgi:hypothetical protein
MIRHLIILFTLLSPLPLATGAATVSDVEGFFKDIGPRNVGSPGNLLVEKKVAEIFAASALDEDHHGEINFTAPSFLTGATQLQIDGFDPIDILPMHPTMVRPGNFTEKQFDASLVYLGRGSYDDLEALKSQQLNDTIAVMEYDCGESWMRFMRFGVRGFIFIEPDRYDLIDSQRKIFTSEVAVPRFFLDAVTGDRLRQRLKAATSPLPCKVEAEPSRWKNVDIRDLWVLVPGSNADLQKEVIVVTAPMDSNCIVPSLAEGGQAGANLYLLLELLARLTEKPAERSVLLVAVNGHTHGFIGERKLAWHLVQDPLSVESIRNIIGRDMRLQELYVNAYSKLTLDSINNPDDAALLVEMRTLEDTSTGTPVAIKEPIVAQAKVDVNGRKANLMRKIRGISDDDERERRIAELRAENQSYINVLMLFNKVRPRTELRELSEKEFEILRGYVSQIIQRNKVWLDLNRRELERDNANGRVRTALQGWHVKVVLGLDFTWANDRVCLLTGINSPQKKEIWSRPLGAITTKSAVKLAADLQLAKNPFIDTMTMLGGLTEDYYSPGTVSGCNAFATAAEVAAFTLRNPFTNPGSKFSPGDTVAALPAENVDALLDYVPRLLRAFLDDPGLTTGWEIEKIPIASRTFGSQLKAFMFDEFAASVQPDLPVPNSIIMVLPTLEKIGSNPINPRRSGIIDGDVIQAYFQLTDARAVAFMVGLANSVPTHAYHLDDDFTEVDYIIDAGEVHEKVNSNLDEEIKQDDSIVFALIPCREFPLYENNDTSRIEYTPIGEVEFIVIDGRRNTPPRSYGISAWVNARSSKTFDTSVNQSLPAPYAVYLPDGEVLKLLTGTKTIRLVRTNASTEDPEGVGLTRTDQLEQPDFMAATARDMTHLNRQRLENLRGVTNELAANYVTLSEKQLARMDAATAAADHNEYLRAVYGALGAARKGYERISTMTNDMLMAIVFYMALLLPFCFFMQKLLFKFVRIEAQMAAFAAMFVMTFIVFRFVHPAFRVAEAPEAIFIAFVMGALGAFVIFILYSRFEGEMQLLFQTYSGMDTVEVGASTVGQKAMMIGVNNMKRRRVRTILTTTTIVLITFTMLAFSSISKTMSPTVVPIAKQAPYTGIYFHYPGSIRLDEPTTQAIVDMFSESAGSIAVRRWLLPKQTSARDLVQPLPLEYGDQHIQLDAVLGLQPAEAQLLPNGIPMIEGGRFFSSNEADEAVLPVGTANALKITKEMIGTAKVTIRGYELTVVGLADDEQLRALRELGNHPILPIKSIQTSAFVENVNEANLANDATMQDDSAVFRADTSALMLIPEGTCRRMGGQPYSVSVKFDDDLPGGLWPHVESLLQATRAKFFIGSRNRMTVGSAGHKTSAGTYYIGTGYKTSVGGLSRLIIPLLIAATIILNTMLGTVFERKGEIAIYNAIGLNPKNIRMFFYAEAFVYGIIGAVGGYLIGQLLSIGLSKSGLVQGINLNFSSLTVFVVIFFSILVVMASTIYPTWVASAAAVPSGKRKWSLPDHDGNQMHLVFPFIYNRNVVAGIMGYLTEYFSRFTEASIGNLVVSDEVHAIGEDEAGRTTYSVAYNMALAPFDLGVTQHIEFVARFDEVVESYRVHMTITRLSGQDSNWSTTNIPFMEKLRKHMMNWRNLEATKHHEYVTEAQVYFEPAQA